MKGPEKNEGLPSLLEGLAEPIQSIVGAIREGMGQVKKEINSPETHAAFDAFNHALKTGWEMVRKDMREKVVGIFLMMAGESELKHPKNQNRDVAAEHRPVDEG